MTNNRKTIDMNLNTARLLLRDFQQSDISDVHDISIKDGFNFYSLDGTLESSQELINKSISLAQPKVRQSFKLAVESLDDPGRCIGYVALDDLDSPVKGTPDVGYFVNPEFQGKGYAVEAMSGLIQNILSQRFDIDTLYATVHPDNISSQHVLSKIGFLRVNGENKSITNMQGVEEPRWSYQVERSRVLDFTAK